MKTNVMERMKKQIAVFASVCIVAGLALTYVACSSNDELMSQDVQESQLLKDLSNVNSDILSNAGQTRGKGNGSSRPWTTKEKIQVVKADLEGAVAGGYAGFKLGTKVGTCLGSPITGSVFGTFLGALICGAVESYLAAPEKTRSIKQNIEYAKVSKLCQSTIKEDLKVNDAVVVPLEENVERKLTVDPQLLSSVNLEEKYLNVGNLHNIMLATLDGSVQIDNICETDIDSNSSLFNAILNSKEMEECYNNIISGKMSIDSQDELLKHVMQLFNEVLEQYADRCDDVAFIIKKYVEVINLSNELTDEQKNSIKAGLATALYSSNYWDNVYDEKE